ncbi:MAG: thioredoxin domain-containing protein [Alphaproteobacteria bacterium]|nr:thioredoxin domain-containing protein [Alphaproteobacteria bacterium]
MKALYWFGAVAVVVAGGYGVMQSGMLKSTAAVHAEDALPAQGVQSMMEEAHEMVEPSMEKIAQDLTLEMEEDGEMTIDIPEMVKEATSAVRAENRTDLPEALRYRATDITVGDPNAPVQMVEYASKTCGHCAAFHNKTLKILKDGPIKEGKLFFIYRELPWDNLAMLASKVARCAPQEQQSSFVEVFYSTQEKWAHAKDPVTELKKFARLGGMDSDTFEACAKDETIHATITYGREEALNALKVEGTPTVFIDAQRVKNTQSVATIEKMVDDIIAGM